MKVRNLIFSAAALAIGVAAFTIGSQAQGPLWDKVIVNLPYSVTVGDRTIEPGEYAIRQLPSPGGASRVLLIYKDDFKFETSAMTIPTLDNNTPEDTKVVLHHIGNDYYFDKIWIQGKNYGYEFILPDAVKARERERMQAINVAARYESVPAEDQSVSAQTTTSNETDTTVRSESSESTVASNQSTAPDTTSQNVPSPDTTSQSATTTQESTVAQDTTSQNQDMNRQDTTADRSSDQSDLSANRDMNAGRSMPETSANWLLMLLGGGVLTGAGVAFRRR